MTAPELSPAEQATVDRFEAAEHAPESVVERVAQAIHQANCLVNCDRGPAPEHYRAAAAIDALSGAR